MQIRDVPFRVTDWSTVTPTEHPGASGVAIWRTLAAGNLRVRMVEYSAGYLADHWCGKGHVILVLEGELVTELRNGESFTLKPGVSYQVADDAIPHRSRTGLGAKIFIVD
jgi:quercetin dioxygenase-like cupin family protein